MSETLFSILFALPVLFLNGYVSVHLYKRNERRKYKAYMHHLRIEFPEASTIVLSATASSDRAALRKIKEQLDALS